MRSESIISVLTDVENELNKRHLNKLAGDLNILRKKIVRALEEQDRMEEMP